MTADAYREKWFWNFFADKYDRFVARHTGESYEKLYEIIMSDTQNSNDLLEMATGTGEIAIKISSHVANITAIDFAENMIRIADEKIKEKDISNINFILENCHDLSFDDKSFDTIICSNALHLIENPQIVMEEMHRVLKDDGQIIVPVVCHGESNATRLLSGIMSLSGFKAINKWSVDTFKKFVIDNNFKTEGIEIIKDRMPIAYIRAKKA